MNVSVLGEGMGKGNGHEPPAHLPCLALAQAWVCSEEKAGCCLLLPFLIVLCLRGYERGEEDLGCEIREGWIRERGREDQDDYDSHAAMLQIGAQSCCSSQHCHSRFVLL